MASMGVLNREEILVKAAIGEYIPLKWMSLASGNS
jgi:hypothetical protein